MLHLAQIQKNSTSGNRELQILACQIDKSVWKLARSTPIPLEDFVSFPEGMLVLLDKNPDNTINNLQPAKDWILNLIQKYLTKDTLDSQLLAAEQSKIEQWRQEITVQNLELNRRFLEIETRREQLQELEQSLKHDRERLQLWAASLQQKQSEMMEH